MTCFSQLNRRLDIQKPQRVSDGMGGSNVSWSLLDTVWASLKPRHSVEKFDAEKVTAKTTHTIIIRYRNDLLPDMRFVLGARVFEIVSIINVKEQNTWLECVCVEKVL